MNNKFRILLLAIPLGLIFICGFIFWSMWLMEIEDHYGDDQEIYFKSNDGDLIVDSENKECGLLIKTWKNIHVQDLNSKKENDLYNWLHDNPNRKNIELYDFDLKNELFDFNSIDSVIKNKSFKPYYQTEIEQY